MKHKMLQRMLTVGTMAIASLVMTAAAYATPVTYDFTAQITKINTGSSKVLGKVNSTFTGSLTVDTNSFDVKINGLPQDRTLNSMSISYEKNAKQVSAGESVNIQPGGNYMGNYETHFLLKGQNNPLPSSLSLSGGPGTLTVSGWLQSKGDFNIDAKLTVLATHGGGSGPSSTPELDPRSGAGALGLLLGGLGMVFARRRSSK